MMPKHLKEEDDKIWAIMSSRHDPDEEIEPEDLLAELKALHEEYGSPELNAWCKRQEEIYEDRCRRGVERS